MTGKKGIFSVLLIFLFLFVQFVIQASAAGSGGKSVSKKALKLVKKADKNMKEENVDKAMELYKKAISIEPDYAAPHAGVGKILFNQNKFEEAAGSLGKAVKLDPDSSGAKDLLAQSLFFLGQTKTNEKKIKDANEYFLKILEIPGIETLDLEVLPKTLFLLGFNYSQLKDLNKSTEFFQKILEIPEIEKKDLKVFARANFNLGVNLTQLKKPEEARQYLLKYLVIQTENPTDPLLPIANFILGANSYSVLEKEAEKIKKDKSVKKPKTRISILAKTKSEIEKYLTRAIEMKPDIEQAYLTLGNYYYLCQNIKKALETYEKLIKTFPLSKDIATYHSFVDVLKKELSTKKEKK